MHKGERVAYIFTSLKHPSEIELLRRVYRNSFYVISVYTPRDKRQENLRRRIAQSRQKQYADAEIKGIVEKLIERDESEKDLTASGQNVRETYTEADVFIDLTNIGDCEKSVKRFIELIHGNTFHTPNNDEFAMFIAYAASRRSGSLARQVGAVITNVYGDIIATGMNEVPRVGGGVFVKDPGNYILGYDPNDRYKNYVLHDLLSKFVDLGIINDPKIDIDKFIDQNKKTLKNTYLMNIIEYVREVHAEMTALASVARNLTQMKDCTLYSTTFPCHICTKHIISSGIQKVVYIEPYPKSLAGELYTEFITVDESHTRNDTVLFTSFVGVAPRCYMKIFEISERKDAHGNIIKWKPLEAKLRYYEDC